MHIFESQEFSKQLRKTLSREQQRQVYKRINTLQQHEGKILGPKWFKELRFGSKRVYYAQKQHIALFITSSSKKNQQYMIERIRTQEKRILTQLNELE